MLKTLITDGNATGLAAHVHRLSGSQSKHMGLVVLQERFLQFNPELHPFLNDTFGTAMNQNISFSGTPEIIHNGGTSTEWTGTAIAGTWNFADTGKISLTSGNNNDESSFAEETPTTINVSGFTTLTGKINLTIYNSTNNSHKVAFDNAGTIVGNSVNLNDYIDTGLIGTEQSFVIPKADLGLTSQLVDGFTIILVRIGGAKPTMTFDDIQLEQTGTSAVFKATTPIGTTYHIDQFRFAMADNITGIITGSTTTYPTMPGLSYNKLLGVSALSNGIVFQRVQDGKVNFAATLKQLGDFLATGSNIVNLVSDGTNTHLTLEVIFNEPIILKGGADNFLSLTINDDLSGLLLLTAVARGAIEVQR